MRPRGRFRIYFLLILLYDCNDKRIKTAEERKKRKCKTGLKIIDMLQEAGVAIGTSVKRHDPDETGHTPMISQGPYSPSTTTGFGPSRAHSRQKEKGKKDKSKRTDKPKIQIKGKVGNHDKNKSNSKSKAKDEEGLVKIKDKGSSIKIKNKADGTTQTITKEPNLYTTFNPLIKDTGSDLDPSIGTKVNAGLGLRSGGPGSLTAGFRGRTAGEVGGADDADADRDSDVSWRPGDDGALVRGVDENGGLWNRMKRDCLEVRVLL
ncbi:uncharacterized protein I303_105175 [Kwoniella dejecticola CBS 10117]|uniref:Uncharacterized protein n=1 Tax=Kwoniella dejecticola CBS 10117 TaxID=1296121 RepID=A0A1A6A389_9TREE|nr:uncharacterized protein I303_05378 [Kwoniella dejecticola CBS 10117]OBR84520.1 hypothetical protein I303_05378 [Kwoniella dejecticola CBS 10117]